MAMTPPLFSRFRMLMKVLRMYNLIAFLMVFTLVLRCWLFMPRVVQNIAYSLFVWWGGLPPDFGLDVAAPAVEEVPDDTDDDWLGDLEYESWLAANPDLLQPWPPGR